MDERTDKERPVEKDKDKRYVTGSWEKDEIYRGDMKRGER